MEQNNISLNDIFFFEEITNTPFECEIARSKNYA